MSENKKPEKSDSRWARFWRQPSSKWLLGIPIGAWSQRETSLHSLHSRHRATAGKEGTAGQKRNRRARVQGADRGSSDHGERILLLRHRFGTRPRPRRVGLPDRFPRSDHGTRSVLFRNPARPLPLVAVAPGDLVARICRRSAAVPPGSPTR